MTRVPGCLVALSIAWTLCLAGCSPSLDWREARPAGDTLVLLFPCKPELRERTVSVAGAALPMRQLACDAAGLHFSLASLDAETPARVEPLLAAMKATLSSNLGAPASAAATPAFAPVGATPNEGSARIVVAGHLPDGSALRAESGLFVHGLRVYQATVLGDASPGEATSTFLQSIRVAPATPGGPSVPRPGGN